MRPLPLHWKNFLLPGGIGLVGIWSLYLGGVALFGPIETSRDDGAERSTKRSLTDSRGGRGGNSTAALSLIDSESEDASVSSASRENDSPSNSLPSSRLGGKIFGTLSKGKSNGLGGPHFKIGIKSGQEDAREVLRESIMNEAYTLAIKSEKPWQNLMAVAMEYYRRGEKVEAQDILRMAEKMAADPDEPLGSSIAVREVVKVMLAQRLTEDAMAALQNIQNTRERERSAAEVAAWSARFGDLVMARSYQGE